MKTPRWNILFIYIYIYIYINNNYNKWIYIRFIYLMPWKFICNLWFHKVLQTTIIRQTIVVSKTSWNRRSQTNFRGIKYINLIHIYLLLLLLSLLYNSSTSDIEHSPNYITLGLPQSELVTTNTVAIYIYIYIYSRNTTA